METNPQRQIDEMSRVVGRIEGALASIEKYVHEFRHDENNRRHADQLFQDKIVSCLNTIRAELREEREKDAQAAARVRIEDAKAVAKLRLDDQQSVQSLAHRLEELERTNTRREGLWGAVDYVLHSPLIGWLVGALSIVWAVLTGRLHL